MGREARLTIWNENNRVPLALMIRDSGTTSWTHANNSTWSALNGSAFHRFSFITGRVIEPISAELNYRASTAAGANSVVGIVYDSTSSSPYNSNQIYTTSGTSGGVVNLTAKINDFPPLGYHFLQAVEYSTGAISTFYGYSLQLFQGGFLFNGYF